MTAILAQNQLIFVFGGIQPNMNMEITRQMDIKNFIGTYCTRWPNGDGPAQQHCLNWFIINVVELMEQSLTVCSLEQWRRKGGGKRGITPPGVYGGG